jgi:hypothetical protein
MTNLRRFHLRLGLLSGLLMGLALALGTWLPHAIALRGAHIRLLYPPLFLGSLLLILLGGLGGWLAARFENAALWGGVWAVMAIPMTLVIVHTPYEGRSLIVWLVERRLWGLPVSPFNASAQSGQWPVGFFVIILLAILGLIQHYRLEDLLSETDARGRLSGYGWVRLALPLPLVLAAGLLADEFGNKPARFAPQLVQEAVDTALTYPGDLFELSRRKGVNYNALSAVRDQLGGDYALIIGETEASTETILVVVHFDNGAWINCWVIGGNLSSCYDASPPYLLGFSNLLSGAEMSQDCSECKVQADDAQRNWLLARAGKLGGTPRFTRSAQWGSYVLMRAQTLAGSAEFSPASDYAIECRFQGIREIKLEQCREVND